MTTIHSGFSDVSYEPVAQTFFGFRAFKIAEAGEKDRGAARARLVAPGTPDRPGDPPVVRGGLRGVFMDEYQWGDGPNEAMCLTGYPNQPPNTRTHYAGKPHQLLLPECSCGFWAYTNGAHVLSVNGVAALGVIEGWGRMVLGPHGFRCQKARIVALAFTDEVETAMIDSAFSVGRDSVAAFITALTRAAEAMRSRLTEMMTGKPAPPPAPATPPITRASRPWEHVDPVLRRDVARAYPSARVFHSVRSMLTEFPMSDLSALLPPPEPECDTPEDN